ncbi:HNH endonuclease [Carnobacterium divergens]|uniref:HNH endonuclease n=1 Tax=Carnobacterium divergens TaxID=2748 RepID=A0AAW8RDX5_CARDV|nr:HNH endonuclease [Carnobacterium divergens]MDT1975130.1 HNH endonuclease [Carnobacterium divergens]
MYRGNDEEFRAWQRKFYNSKRWKTLRDEVRNDKKMHCECGCGKLITGKSIVDHIEEITPTNRHDDSITLNKSNLQLLSLEHHNTKTFADDMCFDVEGRRDVNLF